jgi:hypothetical protein
VRRQQVEQNPPEKIIVIKDPDDGGRYCARQCFRIRIPYSRLFDECTTGAMYFQGGKINRYADPDPCFLSGAEKNSWDCGSGSLFFPGGKINSWECGLGFNDFDFF